MTTERADGATAPPALAGASGPRSLGYRSKTLATWLALIGGSVGLHRLYLHGARDIAAWLHLPPTALGLYGVMRLNELGQDDRLAWLLIPVLGLMLAGTMLVAICYGLMPDEKWNARFNPAGRQHRTGWAAIIGVILALAIGGAVLMATIAYSGEHYFSYRIEEAKKLGEPPAIR